MVGKFVFGMLSGGALVAGGFIIGSAMAPVQAPPAANDSAPVTSEAPAAPAAEAPATETAAVTPEAAPEAAPEAVPEVEPETAAAAPEEPAQVESAEVDPEASPEAPASEPAAEPAVAAEPAATEEAEAPAAEAAEPALPVAEAEAETATVNESLPAPEPVAVEPAAPEPEAADTAFADPATAETPEATAEAVAEPAVETAAAPPETVAEAPAAPEATAVAEPEPAPAETAVAEVQPPAPPLAPPPLPQLSTDGVLAALDRSASDVAPVVVAEAAPETEVAPAPAPEAPAEPAPEPAAEPAPEAAPEPAPEPLPEVAEAEMPTVEPPVSDDGMIAPPLDDSATARLPGTAAPSMPGSRPATLPGTAGDTGDAAVPEPEVAVLPEATGDGPAFVPAPGATDAADGVVVNRLPRIGDAPAEDAAEATPAADAATPADTRPIAVYAASFENPDAKPVLAIVLVDIGSVDLDRAGLAALPFPVTFALDPMDPATLERAAVYRAAGKEVVMLATGIADGSQASDIEVAFQSMEQGLPEAVAVMDLPVAAFQDRRPLASLVVPVVGAQGRGLLTWDQGLNAADQVARREDIAAAVIFRDLTSAGEDGTAIRRVLDRAVFKAGQDGRVTVAATATPETVATLLEWTVEGRAATVAIGPLTAVMTVE